MKEKFAIKICGVKFLEISVAEIELLKLKHFNYTKLQKFYNISIKLGHKPAILFQSNIFKVSSNHHAV